MRLGDLDALKEALNKDNERFGDVPWHISAIETEIDALPTIDAVPVVRCKDCIHYDMRSKESGYCYFWDHEQGMEPNRVVYDDFCSYGERKDGEG